jgi:hypothetical protein
MMVATRGNSMPAGLVLAFHALLLYGLLLERPDTEQRKALHFSRVIFVVTPRPMPAREKPEVPRTLAMQGRHEKAVPRTVPVPIESPLSPASETPPAAARDDAFDTPTRINLDSLIKQAGKADRDTRSDSEMRAYGPASDSLNAVMTRAFAAAKLAVPLKWHEAAHIELFSAPNDTRRIYQVKTPFGTYCLFYPDTVRDQGGAAASGQPTMSTCPKKFGAGAK